MCSRKWLGWIGIWGIVLACSLARAAPLGTAFTYQGQLKQGGIPVNDTCDFEFSLWDAEDGPAQVSPTLTFDGVGDNPDPISVVNGLFTVKLDFGNIYYGYARWLRIEVTCPGSPTAVLERQELTPGPSALFAAGALWQLTGSDIYNVNAGNVGIGTKIPAVKLDVAGDGKFTGGDVSVWAGTKAVTLRQDSTDTYLSNKVNFNGNGATDNGVLWLNGQGGIGLRYGGSAAPDDWGGTEALRVDTVGNVGIGTTAPTSLLDVRGGAIRASRATNQYIEIVDNSAAGGLITGHSPEGNKKPLYIQNLHDGSGSPAGETQISFRVGDEAAPTEVMRIRENGNVGIGTATPASKLDVEGGAAIGATYSGTTAAPTNGLIVQGNVGIGTATPDATLDVAGTIVSTAAGDATLFYAKANASGTPTGDGIRMRWENNFMGTGDTLIFEKTDGNTTNPDGGISFVNTGNDGIVEPLLHLDGNGNVGIGTPTPGANLDISSHSTNLTTLNLGNTSADQRYLLQVVGPAHGGAAREGNFEIWGTTTGLNKNVFTATPEGCVGVGTTNPRCDITGLVDGVVARLHVVAPPNGPDTFEYAAWFDGRVRANVLEIAGADVAEKFPVSDKVEPGTVVEIDPEQPGQLRLSRGAYNRRVAGVVSGAGGLSVGAILGNLPGHEDAPPIALSGRVYVYCDASNGPIQPGDLLTTSDTPGHAMKVSDFAKAQGAIIGKAMTSMSEGNGLVLVLVSLQ